MKKRADQTTDDDQPEGEITEEAEGTIHPAEDAVEELPQPEVVPEVTEREPEKLTFNEVVEQVLKGEWGVGQDRRLRLSKAGHNPNEVQKEIVRRANFR